MPLAPNRRPTEFEDRLRAAVRENEAFIEAMSVPFGISASQVELFHQVRRLTEQVNESHRAVLELFEQQQEVRRG